MHYIFPVFLFYLPSVEVIVGATFVKFRFYSMCPTASTKSTGRKQLVGFSTVVENCVNPNGFEHQIA